MSDIETGKARFARFIRDREYSFWSGKVIDGWPLKMEFAEAGELFSRIAEENQHFREDLREDYPGYIPLAMPLVATDEEYSNMNPSDLDEFLVVDTSSEAHPVLLWTHDTEFEVIADSFGNFLSRLR